MVAVIQRVSEASVRVEENSIGKINGGLLLLIGITHDDNEMDVDWLVNKTIHLRIFSDNEKKINLSVLDINGDILVVSQFTLLASTRKGTRPSFVNAASPDIAIPLYQSFIQKLEAAAGKTISKGIFGADMKISLINDGPVTIIIDTKNKN